MTCVPNGEGVDEPKRAMISLVINGTTGTIGPENTKNGVAKCENDVK